MKKSLYLALALVFISAVWYGCKDKIELPGELHGVVTDKATGEPIKTAGVELQPVGLKTVTGTDGQYGFNEIEPGKYKLYITKTGYADWLSNEIVVKSEQIAQGDVQLEKLPPALRIVNDKQEDIDGLDFGAGEDDVMRSFNVFNDGTQTLQWQITKAADWITNVSKESGVLLPGALQTIIVTIDRAKLKEGDNVTTMHITSNDGSGQLNLKAKGWNLPVLNTLQVTEIKKTTARLNGEVTNVGQPSYTERGFVYSTSSQPTIENTIRKLTVVVSDSSTFSATVTGVTEGEGYYVRAYAVNRKGVAYSTNEVYFAYDTSKVIVLEDLGLMVQKMDIPGGYHSWVTAKNLCEASRIGGYSDWRLPTIAELSALCNKQTTIAFSFSQEEYWTSYSYYHDGTYQRGYHYYYINMKSCESSSYLGREPGVEVPCKVRAVRTVTE